MQQQRSASNGARVTESPEELRKRVLPEMKLPQGSKKPENMLHVSPKERADDFAFRQMQLARPCRYYPALNIN